MRRSKEWMQAKYDLNDTIYGLLKQIKTKAVADNDEIFVKVIDDTIGKLVLQPEGNTTA